MMNTTHDGWTNQLSAYMDGELERDRVPELEGHLNDCAPCRGVLDELLRVVDAARTLTTMEPPRDLWPGIATAIASTRAAAGEPRSPDIIALPTAKAAGRPPGLFLTIPQLAAASVVLAVVSAALTWWAGPGLGVGRTAGSMDPGGVAFVATDPSVPPELAGELEALEQVLERARETLDANTVRVLEKNLGIIELAIEESRRALAVDPGNAYLREHLSMTYRGKIDFLREVQGIAEWTS